MHALQSTKPKSQDHRKSQSLVSDIGKSLLRLMQCADTNPKTPIMAPLPRVQMLQMPQVMSTSRNASTPSMECEQPWQSDINLKTRNVSLQTGLARSRLDRSIDQENCTFRPENSHMQRFDPELGSETERKVCNKHALEIM